MVDLMERPTVRGHGLVGNDGLVAVIVSTRPYAAVELVPILLDQGITSIERGRADALTFVQHLQPDLVIAVVDPTRVEDLDLLRSIARATPATLMVLAPTHEALAASLRAGADIYARDGDGSESLDAQIAAVSRRLIASRHPEEDDVLEVGPIRANRAARKAWAAGTELILTNLELSLLFALLENHGRVLSPLQAARIATGRLVGEVEASQTVKVYVRRLRQKLEDAGCPASLIVNVRGRGYMFDPVAADAREQANVAT